MANSPKVIPMIAVALWALSISPAKSQEWRCPGLEGAKPKELMGYLQGDRSSLQRDCVLHAIERLGIRKYVPAVSVLIKYIDYPRPADDGGVHTHAQAVGYLYPAVSSLYRIGKPSVPALISAIAGIESSDLIRTNAAITIFEMHSGKEVGEGIALVMRASREEQDWDSKLRLEKAARYLASRCSAQIQNACMAALQ